MKDSWGTSDGKHHTPQELPFYASDTEELYKENCETNYYELEKNGWSHHAPQLSDRVIGYKYDYNSNDPAINDAPCANLLV